MRPFFTYFGGKWRAAPKYPLPSYDIIVEPFCGSAGYSVRHGAGKEVHLIDANAKIAKLWGWLIEANRQDILDLPHYGFNHVDEIDAPEPAKYLIGFWLNKGAASPCKTPSKWMRSGVRPKSYWGEEIRLIIANQIHAIDGWTVTHGEFDNIPNIDATWFIDPPYQNLPRMYPSKFFDYARLGEFCKSRNGQVIACEGAGADWLPFRHLANIKALEGSNGGKVSSEWVWMKNDKYQEPLLRYETVQDDVRALKRNKGEG